MTPAMGLMPIEQIHSKGLKEGSYSQIDIEDMSIHGRALVTSISDCPAIQPGSGRVVVTTYTRITKDLMELRVSGQDEPIEVTSMHRLYSHDRDDWIAVGQLKVGEHMKTAAGVVTVESLRRLPNRKRVYNLGVEAEHWYFVSKVRMLAHNDYAAIPVFTTVEGFGAGGEVVGAGVVGGGFTIAGAVVVVLGGSYWAGLEIDEKWGVSDYWGRTLSGLKEEDYRNTFDRSTYVLPNKLDVAGSYRPEGPLPRDIHGNPVPEPGALGPHTQLGTQTGRQGDYTQGREFDANGKPVKDIDFTDHGRPDIHTNPHEHPYVPNPTGGTPQRGPAQSITN